VALELSPSGELVELRIVSTSGSDAVDGAALAAVRDAAPFPAPPPEMPLRSKLVLRLTGAR